MKDGDFELGGYLIGRDHPVFVSKFDPSAPEQRVQDKPHPFGNQMSFGVDYETPNAWTFEFSLSEADGDAPDVGVLSEMSKLATLWRRIVDPTVPGAVTPLRYMIGGRIRRVYGRPRGFTPNVSSNIEDGNITATAQFQLEEVVYYDDALQEVELTLRVPPTGWATLPNVWPLVTSIESTRSGAFTVGGTADTFPHEIQIFGPVINPKVTSGDWSVELDTSIPYDGWVKVDPRARTVLRENGASVGGSLSRLTYLPGLTLTPGPKEFTYQGNDSSGASRAVIRWRDAYDSL